MTRRRARPRPRRAALPRAPGRRAAVGIAGESPRTLDQVGRVFNLTRERVRAIETRAGEPRRSPALRGSAEHRRGHVTAPPSGRVPSRRPPGAASRAQGAVEPSGMRGTGGSTPSEVKRAAAATPEAPPRPRADRPPSTRGPRRNGGRTAPPPLLDLLDATVPRGRHRIEQVVVGQLLHAPQDAERVPAGRQPSPLEGAEDALDVRSEHSALAERALSHQPAPAGSSSGSTAGRTTRARRARRRAARPPARSAGAGFPAARSASAAAAPHPRARPDREGRPRPRPRPPAEPARRARPRRRRLVEGRLEGVDRRLVVGTSRRTQRWWNSGPTATPQ